MLDAGYSILAADRVNQNCSLHKRRKHNGRRLLPEAAGSTLCSVGLASGLGSWGFGLRGLCRPLSVLSNHRVHPGQVYLALVGPFPSRSVTTQFVPARVSFRIVRLLTSAT